MSAQAARVLRRDLRRAVGAEAIGVIDHNAQIVASLQQAIVFLSQRSQIHDTWLAELDGKRQLAEQRVAALELQAEQRTWRARLRWVLVGWMYAG